jgi:hypothetical protein
MKRNLWILMLCLVVLAGCATYKGIKPIYPEVGHPNMPKVVDSLQPTFRWEPVPERGATYDFIVYECIKDDDFWKGPRRAVGREIYYREGLNQTEHKIEESLKPNREYFWSVRLRHGQFAQSWSLYNYELFLGTAYMHAKNLPFLFETPPIKE